MRVLVTGGAGYIGSVVAAQLLAAGHEVTILDDLSTGHSDAVPQGAHFVKGTLRDCVAEVLADGADAVVHLAAKSLVGESMADPSKYWSGNLGTTLTLLEAMRVIGVRSIVFSSTAAVYGEPERTPVLETDPLRPTSPYGGSKTAIDTTLTEFARLFGLAPVSLRYFNVAGAHHVAGEGGGWLGERHHPETHLIPNTLAAATQGRPLNVFGTDYPTPDGTCVRDYIHVTDVADAHLRALDACEPGRHRIYNLGSQAGFSVREVIEVCRDVTGLDVAVTEAARRPGDPAVLVASSERIKAELGWTPTRDLRAMAADAWQFTQAQARAQADRAAAEGPGQSNAAAEGPGQSNAAAEGPGQSNAAAGGPGQSNAAAEGPGKTNAASEAGPSPKAPGPATS
jgi:UDP-glucose 4-epimerase